MNGDISIHRIDFERWREMTAEDKEYLMFLSLQGVCSQPEKCGRSFITKKQAVVAGAILSAFIAGASGISIFKVMELATYLGITL